MPYKLNVIDKTLVGLDAVKATQWFELNGASNGFAVFMRHSTLVGTVKVEGSFDRKTVDFDYGALTPGTVSQFIFASTPIPMCRYVRANVTVYTSGDVVSVDFIAA